MTEINKVSGTNSNQQIQILQNQSQAQSQGQIRNQFVDQSSTKDAVTVNIDNSQIVPPLGNENPFVQNPFYQAQQFGKIPQVQYNQPFINQANYTESFSNNLWKYLLVGGLGLLTGLALSSFMPYSYCLYYPMYYSYFYSPCWYNFSWNYQWW